MKMEKSRKKELLGRVSDIMLKSSLIIFVAIIVFCMLGIVSYYFASKAFTEWCFILAGLCFLASMLSLWLSAWLYCLVEDL